MDQSERLRVFLKVAELLSFSRAAEHLSMPRATVSLAVAELEDAVDTRLLLRTTRKVRLTQDGQVFVERAERLLGEFDDLLSLFQRQPARLRGRLRVDLPAGLARDLVVPRLPEFQGAHPELELELSSTDRKVDVIREGFDCVLRVGSADDPSLICRPLGEYSMINCASPEYLAEFGVPRRLEDLAQHRLVDYASTFGVRSTGFEYMQDGQPRTYGMRVQLTVNASDTYLGACLAGLGIVQIPELGARPHLEAGRLREILPNHRPPPLPVALFFPDRRHQPERVRAFMDWLGSVVKPSLDGRRASRKRTTERP